METSVIRADRLSRHFGHVHAVDDLSLDVPGGIVFGFLGPNGSGKTTTIHLLLGLLKPTGGRAEVLGFDSVSQPEEIRARAGALLEYSGLYERMSAEDNLDFVGRIYGMRAAERRARSRELLVPLGLFDRRKEPAARWSRGMKQKLAVARTLFHRPSVVFLDEPTAGFDPVAAAALRDDLLHLVKSQGTTVFLNTHNLVEAEKLCAQVGVISHGKLLAVGGTDELRQRTGGGRALVIGKGLTGEVLALLKAQPRVRGVSAHDGHVSLELAPDAAMAPLVRLMVQAGCELEEVRRDKASLEDVFLQLVEEEHP